ncbi:MAG: hypothetical protein JJU29_01830 [Verrucomicrobia bacterium]|nr:hypothetical protein [Verrucomicrobiota bacterium]MCH8510973.1 hypothetical protein [Kiritimatiellia bacterium]
MNDENPNLKTERPNPNTRDEVEAVKEEAYQEPIRTGRFLGFGRRASQETLRKSASAVRQDLLANSVLLKTLGDNFFFVGGESPGAGGMVIAAPHEAPSKTPLSEGHDVNTGIVARHMAKQMGAKYVVVSELRTFVDVNKAQLESGGEDDDGPPGLKSLREADRLLKQYYQSQLFTDAPSAIIEIHGHVSGNHDIEVSTGFPLKKSVAQDAALVAGLQAFRKELEKSLSKLALFPEGPPSVGIYPLDEGIRFTARGTHTFNKIEKLRELGVNISGLHIELSKRLRVSDAGDKDICEKIGDCLASAIQAFLDGIDRPETFDMKMHLLEDFAEERGNAMLLSDERFELQQVPRELVGESVAVFCRKDLRSLELQEGDRIVVSAQPELTGSIMLDAAQADMVQRGHLGLAKKFRDQLGLSRGGKVYIGKSVQSDFEGLVLAVVADVNQDLAGHEVVAGPALIKKIRKEGGGAALSLHALPDRETEVTVREQENPPYDFALQLSPRVAGKLDVTMGDLVCFVSSANAGGDDHKWRARRDQPDVSSVADGTDSGTSEANPKGE